MSIAIEMDPSVSLDRISPEIIQRIIGLGSDSATEMRFISRTWNEIAKKYLADNHKLSAPLERLYLSRGKPEDLYKGRPYKSTRAKDKMKLNMYAILPERHSKRIGIGEWLQLHSKHGNDAVEVTCYPEHISDLDLRPHNAFAQLCGLCIYLFVFIIAELVAYAIFWPKRQDFAFVSALIIFFCVLNGGIWCWLCRFVTAAISSKKERIDRFLSSFTHIETLVLDSFRFAENNRNSRNAIHVIRQTLGNMRINRLELRENYLNVHLQRFIIEICHANKIQNLSLTVQDVDLRTKSGFSKFVTELSTLGVTFNLFERNGMNDAYYFTQTRAWWNRKMVYLRHQQVSLKMATIHEASFDKTAHQFGVKSHFRFEKWNGQVTTQPLKFTAWTRGFNHRWN